MKATERSLNEIILADFLRVNKSLSHIVYSRMSSSFPDEPVYPQLFEKLLFLEWFNYAIRN